MEKLRDKARVTEIGDVANRLVELFKKTSEVQGDTFLTGVFGEMEKQTKSLTESIKRDTVFSTLEEADAKRDQAVRVIGKLLNGYEYIPIESLKQHGQKLALVFKKYGVKITLENYSSQSNLINAMLNDFSVPELQSSITALAGVSEAIEDLRKSQENFANIRSGYEQAVIEKQNLPSATLLKKPLLELINKKLVPYLIAMEISNAETYGNFTTNSAQIITSINDMVRSRTKKPATSS